MHSCGGSLPLPMMQLAFLLGWKKLTPCCLSPTICSNQAIPTFEFHHPIIFLRSFTATYVSAANNAALAKNKSFNESYLVLTPISTNPWQIDAKGKGLPRCESTPIGCLWICRTLSGFGHREDALLCPYEDPVGSDRFWNKLHLCGYANMGML